MRQATARRSLHLWVLAAGFVVTSMAYWPGLSGGFLFDDFPNIVDNHGVQPHDANFASLLNAALSSPASEFKRPLASLSFAANYLASGLDPYWMKLSNLIIHLLNGLLVFLLARVLVRASAHTSAAVLDLPKDQAAAEDSSDQQGRMDIVAALIAAGWMLLPINLTAVLYVVQRMESMANLFVLLGLLGYVAGRRRMISSGTFSASRRESGWVGFILCLASITLPTIVGALAKETAVMLPLYALLIEWTLFHFSRPPNTDQPAGDEQLQRTPRDLRLIGLFVLVLVLPMLIGLIWLLPSLLKPETWTARDFTMGTRLLSEARIIVDYIAWTVLPTPSALSFYHDNFRVSTGPMTPWSTLASILLLAGLIALLFRLRSSQPLAALGIALFLACQLLTGTILPLELIYEHRNYFASFGLLLTLVPILAAQRTRPFALPRHVLLAGLLLSWAGLTALTAQAWGNPLRLAEDLARRAPRSPRAQYELGRTYIIYSHYDPASPFTRMAYGPLERAAALPDASILPEQAMIFMNARMHLPLKSAWWDSLIAKLESHKPGVQDESSLGALTECAREDHCDLPRDRMIQAFTTALAHPNPSPRLLATYGDYAWNVLDDRALGERMTEAAVRASPNEPAYRITLVRMLVAQGHYDEARHSLDELKTLSIGGRLDSDIARLQALIVSEATSVETGNHP